MQMRILLFSLFIMSNQTSFSQEIIQLWPADNIPKMRAGVFLEETFNKEGGILRIYDVSIPTLTMYAPLVAKSNGTCVMICPGGGYTFLAAGHEGGDVAKWLNELGVTAFVLKYRLPNEKIMYDQQDVPLLDAIQAMSIIRTNAERFRIDPGRIGIMGFSAGGHLASMLATHYHKLPYANQLAKPNFLILIYPVISFSKNAHSGSKERLLGSLKSSQVIIDSFSNELQVSNQTPPTFLVHSQDDQTVPVQNSINFYTACLDKNVPAEMHMDLVN
jgi:acetyl esterase/lipase